MSLLNLNTPAGRGPRSKKSLKMFMGAGLLVAVLGIGSTLAANITLNTPAGTTEFGQGVTQTVYCGGNKSVTITPISAYQNTVKSADTPAVTEVTASVRVLKSYSGDDQVTVTNAATAGARVTINANNSSSAPRWGSSVGLSATPGFWVSNGNTSGPVNAILSSSLTNDQIISGSNNGSLFFAPEIGSSGKFRKTSSFDYRVVTLRIPVALIPGSVTSAASFKVGGVVISGIPPECSGVDFVVSSYAETGAAQTFISKDSDVIKEVAALWTASGDPITPSKDRTAQVSSSLISATQTSSTLKFVFNTATSGAAALSASDLYKLVVETQQDALS